MLTDVSGALIKKQLIDGFHIFYHNQSVKQVN